MLGRQFARRVSLFCCMFGIHKSTLSHALPLVLAEAWCLDAVALQQQCLGTRLQPVPAGAHGNSILDALGCRAECQTYSKRETPPARTGSPACQMMIILVALTFYSPEVGPEVQNRVGFVCCSFGGPGNGVTNAPCGNRFRRPKCRELLHSYCPERVPTK